MSARDSVQDRVKGVNLGADDYLPKPLSVEELLARVRSLLRRRSSVKKTVLEHRGLELDLLGRTVHFNDKALDLTRREYGRILPRNLR